MIWSIHLLFFLKTRAENEELREGLSEVTAQHNSVLEENQRLRAKLENLEQVLKVQLGSDNCNCELFSVLLLIMPNYLLITFWFEQHMREVAERRQQLELEHEQALAILKFKQDEIKRLQRVKNRLLYTLYFYHKHLSLMADFSLPVENGVHRPAGGNLQAPIKLGFLQQHLLCCEFEFYDQITNVTLTLVSF